MVKTMKCSTRYLTVAIIALTGHSTATQLVPDVTNAVPYSLASVGGDLSEGALSEVIGMKTIFARSEQEHRRSMTRIMEDLTVPKAMDVLQLSMPNDTLTSLEQVVNLIGGATHADEQKFTYGGNVAKSSLRASNTHKSKQPTGYSGLDGARKMLNDMIYESLSKYDTEIAKCTEFYSKQCALMQIARGAIAAANFVAAASRGLILDAQYNINKCEVAIPETKLELKDHNRKCKNELNKLNQRLKIVMGDIAVMTSILKMTDCNAKLVQTNKFVMLRCDDKCTHRSYVTFNHTDLQRSLSQLKSSVSIDLLKHQLNGMFDANATLESAQLMQADNSGQQDPIVKKTEFNNPPVPHTQVPDKPGTPPASVDKRCVQCSMSGNPQCYKLQSRFLAIQGGISDERDQIMEDISNMERDCEEQRKLLESSIADDEALLASSQTKLAEATEKESTAGEEARQTAKENAQYNADLIKQMKTCSNNYINFETELCALKKIRGELYKMKGGGHSAFFQDCEVSQWDPEECSKVCAGGVQKLSRNVLTLPEGGAKCLPLAAMKSCNNHPCPVDCKLDEWGGWSKCSAKCGGGVTQRVRDVQVAMKYGGKPCDKTSQTKVCNAAACEKDCELSEWTKWTGCSKDCDGGTRKRQKFVSSPAEGDGTCPDAWGAERLQYRQCNMKRCILPPDKETITCNTTMDVILLIDECPKSGKDGFKQEIAAASLLVDAYSGSGITAIPNFAIIKYCGPRTWSGVSKCAGKSKDGAEKVDMEKVCRIKVVQHFSEDAKKTKGALNGLEFAKGTKLVALALLSAKAELTLGRKTAQSVVVTFTDGQPLSFRKTRLASRSLRKTTRLLWVVVSKFSPLKDIKKWASRRWQENLVKVDSYQELGAPDTVTHIVANICPKKFPKLKAKKK